MRKFLKMTGDSDMVSLIANPDTVPGDWEKTGEWKNDFIKFERCSPVFDSAETAHERMETSPRFFVNGDKITDVITYSIALAFEVLLASLLNWIAKNPSSEYEYLDCSKYIEDDSMYLDGGLFGLKMSAPNDGQLTVWMYARVA